MNYTLMKINVAKLHQRLYILNLPTIPNTCLHLCSSPSNKLMIDTYTLWNNILGHSSNETMIHINKGILVYNISKSIKPCDTSVYDKHEILLLQENKTILS